MVSQHEQVTEEVVDLLGHLVAYPTESRTPNRDLVDFVSTRSQSRGGAVRVIDGPPGRANALVRFGPQAPGGVVVCGHTDVVPAGRGWNTDPYALTVVDDQLHGRGTADMKGFIAAALAEAWSRDTSAWHAPLYVALSFDEEVGCAGVASLLDDMAADEAVQPLVAVAGEPTMMQVRTSHAGKVSYRVHTSCASGHSSRSATRTNAVAEAVAIAAEVFALNTRHGQRGVSANVGTLSGGIAVNVLAPSCELTFECRHPSTVAPDQVLTEVWRQVESSRAALEALQGALEVTREAAYPGLSLPVEHPEVRRVAHVMNAVCGGDLGYGSEAGLYVQALGVPCVVCGPGDIAHAHRPDEFVTFDQLALARQAVAHLVDAYCVRNDR